MIFRTLYEHEDLTVMFNTESVYVDNNYVYESKLNINSITIHVDGLDIELANCVVRTPCVGVSLLEFEEKIFRKLLALR